MARLVTLGRNTPRGDRMRVTLAGLGLTTTVRVVNRVHGSTTNGRADAAPTLGTGLAQLFQAVLVVADFADGGAALDRNLAHFTRAQAQGGVDAFASHQLHGRTSGASDLSALARLQLDAVDGGADRDVAQRQGVAGLDRGVRTSDHLITGLQALRGDDVATLTIDVAQQGDVGGAVGSYSDAFHARRDAQLVALEVDDAVVLLGTTTDVTHGDAAVVVAATRAALRLDQCGVRSTLVQVGRNTRTAERRPGEVGLNFINGMGCTSGLGRYIDRLAVGQANVRLAPIAAAASTVTEGLVLALDVDHVDGFDLTSNSCSTAAFTSALVASFETSKTYWLESSCRRAVFSETRGARSTLKIFSLLFMPALLDLLDRVSGDDDRVGTHQRDRIQTLDVTHLHVRQIAGGQVQVLGRFFGDDQRALAHFQAGQLGDQTLRVGHFDIEGLHDGQTALTVQLGQDRAHGGTVLLTIDLLLEACAAWPRR